MQCSEQTIAGCLADLMELPPCLWRRWEGYGPQRGGKHEQSASKQVGRQTIVAPMSPSRSKTAALERCMSSFAAAHYIPCVLANCSMMLL